MPVPIAVIVCEGNIETIVHISDALDRKVPVIIIKGSGKAADLVLLFAALKANRCDYVKVLLDQGVVFDINYLPELYDKSAIQEPLRFVTAPFTKYVANSVKDLLVFMFIAVFVMLSVGIYYLANLCPDRQLDWNEEGTVVTLWNVFVFPYWQLNGELYKEYIYGNCKKTKVSEEQKDNKLKKYREDYQKSAALSITNSGLGVN
uniref:TRPM SLOG domain-containing protein n=1 Tax=Magallana gigas TaxID=29159 RepID=K1PR56_MAGGI